MHKRARSSRLTIRWWDNTPTPRARDFPALRTPPKKRKNHIPLEDLSKMWQMKNYLAWKRQARPGEELGPSLVDRDDLPTDQREDLMLAQFDARRKLQAAAVKAAAKIELEAARINIAAAEPLRAQVIAHPAKKQKRRRVPRLMATPVAVETVRVQDGDIDAEEANNFLGTPAEEDEEIIADATEASEQRAEGGVRAGEEEAIEQPASEVDAIDVEPEAEAAEPILFGDDFAVATEGEVTAPQEEARPAQASEDEDVVLFGDDFAAATTGDDADGERAGSDERDTSGADESSDSSEEQEGGAGGGEEGDESDAEDGGATGFVGCDTKDAAKVVRCADKFLSIFPHAWREKTLSFGKPTSLSTEKRMTNLRRRIIKKNSVSIASRMLSGARYLLKYQMDNGLGPLDMTADVLIDCLEEYSERAQIEAKKREKKQKRNGRKKRRNCRGGKTAAMAIFHGIRNIGKIAGLPVDWEPPEVKEVAKCGPGMPAIKAMTNTQTVLKCERITTDEGNSEYVRAYAGGTWLKIPAATRTVDMQRTPKITFEHVKVFGETTKVATGISRRSKASSQIEMRPLVWRAPIIPIGGGEVDLEPLIKSMPGGPNGCVFRDFVTPEGVPHTIDNATAWANSAASHQTVRDSIKAITGDDLAGGHEERHYIPSVGKVMKMPRTTREALGYWREQPVVANDPEDERAMRAALVKARQRRSRAGSIASSADRYANVSGEAIEQDEARVACMLAVRECVLHKWNGSAPETVDEQLRDISAAEGEK
jgi:hypothetical protein